MIQRVTTNDSDWHKEWKWVTTSGATSDNEWKRVVQNWQQVTTSDTTSDDEWQRITRNGN